MLRVGALFASLGLAAAAGGGASRTMNKFVLDTTTTYPDAICNDGTPGTYYFDESGAPAGSAQANTWIVYLQDGGWCYSKKECDARLIAQSSSCTSKYFGDTMSFPLGSLLNAGADTNFGDVNVIYVRYCSSDAYVGNKAAEVTFSESAFTTPQGDNSAPSNIHFRGRHIAKAVLQELAATHGMSTTTAQTVVLAGSSAGSRGVLHNLNHMKTDFASYGWTQISTSGIIDSGLYIVQPTIDWTKTDLDVQARQIVTYTNADVDPICAAEMATQYPATAGPPAYADVTTIDPSGQKWRCLIAQFALTTIQIPHVVHQFQMDAWGTFVQLPIPYGWMTKEISYARPAWRSTMQTYRDIVRQVLMTPPSAAQIASGGTRAVHASACYQHMNMAGAHFTTKYKINGVSLGNVVDSFIFGKAGPTFMIENCSGWECGADCVYDRSENAAASVETDTVMDVCGWWYWFTALRNMSPQCQNSLVDYHVSGLFEWPMDEACPCILAVEKAHPGIMANHKCPHLFAYGYSSGVPGPNYPGDFPYRPLQQPNPPGSYPLRMDELAVKCMSWSPSMPSATSTTTYCSPEIAMTTCVAAGATCDPNLSTCPPGYMCSCTSARRALLFGSPAATPSTCSCVVGTY